MEWRRPGTGRDDSTRLGDTITHVDLVKSRGRFTWNCRLHEGLGRRMILWPGRGGVGWEWVGGFKILEALIIKTLQ